MDKAATLRLELDSVTRSELRPWKATKPSSSVLNAIPLAGEMADMASPQLKMMMTTYAPGNRGARHNHQGRPEVVYVLDGAIVDHRAEGSVEYSKGQSCFVNNGAEHWMENRGATPAVLLVAMVRSGLSALAAAPLLRQAVTLRADELIGERP